MSAEIFTDEQGRLISLAQYMPTTAKKKKRIVEELSELNTRLRALREELDAFHEKDVYSRKGLTFNEREKYRVIRAEHGQTMRNIATLKTLMGKWMYV